MLRGVFRDGTLIGTVVLFFILGFATRLAGSELKLPTPLYDALSIYLRPAIGLRGGVLRPDKFGPR